MRCVAVFVGINHASAVSFCLWCERVIFLPQIALVDNRDPVSCGRKIVGWVCDKSQENPNPNVTLTVPQKIEFANNLQFSLTLAAMSIGLWWLFDRSRCGFGLGVAIATLATFVTQLLVYNGVYRWVRCSHSCTIVLSSAQKRVLVLVTNKGLLQIHWARLPLHTILAALHFLLWRGDHGKHWTTISCCKYSLVLKAGRPVTSTQLSSSLTTLPHGLHPDSAKANASFLLVIMVWKFPVEAKNPKWQEDNFVLLARLAVPCVSTLSQWQHARRGPKNFWKEEAENNLPIFVSFLCRMMPCQKRKSSSRLRTTKNMKTRKLLAGFMNSAMEARSCQTELTRSCLCTSFRVSQPKTFCWSHCVQCWKPLNGVRWNWQANRLVELRN